MASARFVAAPAPRPIPAARRHIYEYDPDTRRCKECPLPKSNKRMHIPAPEQRAGWREYDERRLGEYALTR
jgi:hypothetical protein